MKTLKTFLLGGVLAAVGLQAFSQYADTARIMRFDVNKKNELSLSQETKYSSYHFLGEEPIEGELRNRCENIIFYGYYRNDESSLNTNDRNDLERYLDMIGEKKYYQVRGYADINGESEYNYDLSLKRALGYADIIKKKYPDSYVEIVSVGESGSDKDLYENRKTMIIPDEPAFYTDLKESDSKYFLLDLSGSMNEYIPHTKIPKYLVLQRVGFPEDSEVYGFFSGRLPEGRADLNKFRPRGGSYIYFSAKKLIEEVIPRNESLDILTDGISTDVGVDDSDLIKSAKEKFVKVSVYGIGIPKDKTDEYRNVAKETGGKYSLGISFDR